MPLQHRREHEQSPDTEDDAGHRRQQLDRDADGPLQQRRTQFGQEQGDAETRRHRKQHGDQRGHHGAVNRRQRAELIGDRIPNLAGHEGEAEMR